MILDFLTQYNTNIFSRTTTVISKPSGVPIRSASLDDMGGAFILLGASAPANTVCRLRLYGNESSMITDAPRVPGNFNLNPSIALIADIFLTGSTPHVVMNPPIIGNTFSGGKLWYHLSGSAGIPIDVTLESYPIKPIRDSTDGDISIVISGSSIPNTGNGVSGTITTSKSFLILSGSATVVSRLRLYSRPHTEIPTAEVTRAFDTEPQSGSLLIADLMFDSANFQYPLVPVLEGYTWTASEYDVGSGQLGYILQNRSGGTANVTASIYAYSLEN
jgi:hypothetical protein